MLSRFLVVEGVHGAGKTYLTNVLKEELFKRSYSVFTTKQPSERFNRNDEEIKGERLLSKILEDRNYHMMEVVGKNLPNYDFLICDRYIVSTLVYQRIDGIDFSRIWRLNRDYLRPFLTIFLNPSPEKVEKHLMERNSLTRFESQSYRELERRYYVEAIQLLERKGFSIIQINDSYEEPVQTLVDNLIKSTP